MAIAPERQNAVRDTRLVNVEEVRRAYDLHTTPGQIVEIRALKASRDQNSRYTETLGGYFDNPDDLIREICTIRSAMGIYITLHPCDPNLLHRAKNKLVKQDKDFSTPDKYITGYQRLAIDCDPERVSGISSTEEEHQKALAMCRKIREALREQGWPEPVLADSGNGGHLLYRIDLPTSDAQLVKRTLEGLQQFNESDVHVDLTLFNPSRIIKLYGTLACKGDNTEERPHRLSRILEAPDALQIVSREQLEAIATPVEPVVKQKEVYRPSSNGYKNNQYTRESFTLESWIAKHGIGVKSSSPYNGGTRYLLEACAWDPSHTDNSACLYDMPNGLGASCSHHSCQGKHWEDFRLVYEPDAYTTREPAKTQKTAKSSELHQNPTNQNTVMYDIEVKDELLCRYSADDAGNGEAMYALFGDNFVYNEAVGWMYYTGTHWQADEGHARLMEAAIKTLRKRRHAAVEANREHIIKATVSNTQRINGTIACFRPHVLKSIDNFDAEEHLLNCKNGVVNLKTGELTPHGRDQYFSYCVPIEYQACEAQEWIEYLQGVVGGGNDMIDYLQLALGYSLTGSTREECLFYVYGPSRSGKGTVAEIILRLLPRPLSTMVDFNSFTAKREGDVSNFDLAELKPSRVVFASESQRNQSLNPAKIKQLTGGDLVRASFKHKNFFTYRPQFKVWMLSNWPVNGDPEDDALWGRVRVIPFPNSYLGKEDKGKKERLKSDEVLTSILYWAVQGAMKWYSLGSSGLQTPTYVANVTKEQRDSQDFVQQWMKECCQVAKDDEDVWTSNETIMTSYNQWCETNSVTPKKAKALAQSLQTKGFQTGVAKWKDGKTKKGVQGLIMNPIQLFTNEPPKKGTFPLDCNPENENLTDTITLTDLTGETTNSQKMNHKGEYSETPVRSVRDEQSVRLAENITDWDESVIRLAEPDEAHSVTDLTDLTDETRNILDQSQDEASLDYEAAFQLISEIEASGGRLCYFEGEFEIQAPPSTRWQWEDWSKRKADLDTELRNFYSNVEQGCAQ